MKQNLMVGEKALAQTVGTRFYADWTSNDHLDPTVQAIGSTDTILKIKRLTSFDRAPPGIDYAREFIRMDEVAGGPVLQSSLVLPVYCKA